MIQKSPCKENKRSAWGNIDNLKRVFNCIYAYTKRTFHFTLIWTWRSLSKSIKAILLTFRSKKKKLLPSMVHGMSKPNSSLFMLKVLTRIAFAGSNSLTKHDMLPSSRYMLTFSLLWPCTMVFHNKLGQCGNSSILSSEINKCGWVFTNLYTKIILFH